MEGLSFFPKVVSGGLGGVQEHPELDRGFHYSGERSVWLGAHPPVHTEIRGQVRRGGSTFNGGVVSLGYRDKQALQRFSAW